MLSFKIFKQYILLSIIDMYGIAENLTLYLLNFLLNKNEPPVYQEVHNFLLLNFMI